MKCILVMQETGNFSFRILRFQKYKSRMSTFPQCPIVFHTGYNTRKKKQFISQHGNSGHLRLSFTNLCEPKLGSPRVTSFFSKPSKSSTRDLSVHFRPHAEMKLAVSKGQQGTIEVSTGVSGTQPYRSNTETKFR